MMEKLLASWSRPMEIRCEKLAQRLDKCEPCIHELGALKSRLLMLETTFLAQVDAKNIPLMKQVEEDVNAQAALDRRLLEEQTALERQPLERETLQQRLVERRANQLSRSHSADHVLNTTKRFIDKDLVVSSRQTWCPGVVGSEGNIVKVTSEVIDSLTLEVNKLTMGQASVGRVQRGLVGSASSNRGVYALKNPGRQRDPSCDCQEPGVLWQGAALSEQQQPKQQTEQRRPFLAAKLRASQQGLSDTASQGLSWHAVGQLPMVPEEASDSSYSMTEQQQRPSSPAGLGLWHNFPT